MEVRKGCARDPLHGTAKSGTLLTFLMTNRDLRTFEIRVKGRRLVTTNELTEARWILKAAAQAGEGAELVDAVTGQVIERHP
jgi:hypothetical protein